MSNDVTGGFRLLRGRLRRSGSVLVTVGLLASVVVIAQPAEAWKPYTHVFTGDNAYADAVDGNVTINGDEYPLNPRLTLALQTHRASYNAGVVGPDAYPDLVMGQSVIHPEDTGVWLNHLLEKAWDAQGDVRYSDDQQLQILAFAYGFMTHAAGDMWAHTLVNDFADGVFPAVGDVVTDPDAAAIALRHIIVEGYIGDATAGYDGNGERSNVAGELNESGVQQVSDDATPGINYDQPPDLFLWEVFVGRAQDISGAYTQPLPGQPTAGRGPIIDFFYTLRNGLAVEAGTNSNIQQAIDNFNGLADDIAYVEAQCSFPPDPIECPIALAVLGLASLAAVLSASADLLEAAAEAVVDAYLAAWVEDIDDGLRHWGNIGDAFAEGLFDPATRRALQDDECYQAGSGAESDLARASCEDAVGLVGTFLDTLGPSFTTADPNLLSMLGAPDFVGDLLAFVDELTAAIDDLIDFPMPFETAIAELKQYLVDEVLLPALSEVLGFDVELFAEILRNPAAWLDEGTPVPLPAPLDIFNTVGLFADGEHERLDAIIGFDQLGQDDGHHTPTKRLDDDAELIIAEFEPLENTITTAKLLLLDGDQLDQVLTNNLGRAMNTYPSGARTNIMIDSLGGGDPWLFAIDSDHAWRQDGLPRFCDAGSPLCAGSGAQERLPAEPNGGNGRMPIWESCVARPAFGQMFTDWENGATQWPALGDDTSSDPGSDPNPPTSSVTLDAASASFHDVGTGRDFVGGDNLFTLGSVDTPANQSFDVGDLEMRYRVTDPNAAVSAWTSVDPGATFSLSGADGEYIVEVQSGDPCHTLAEGDGKDPESIQSFSYWLDTTPPVCTCHTPPFGTIYATDVTAVVDFSLDDGPGGSGVASESAVIDGYVTATGTSPTTDGGVIDMYLLYPGLRTVTVTGTDNIGNTADTDCTFTIRPTSSSIRNNVIRARSEGLIPSLDVYNGLIAKLNQAVSKHVRGQHAVEKFALGAFVDQIEGQIGGGPSGSGIDMVTGRRFIAYARYLIANHP